MQMCSRGKAAGTTKPTCVSEQLAAPVDRHLAEATRAYAAATGILHDRATQAAHAPETACAMRGQAQHLATLARVHAQRWSAPAPDGPPEGACVSARSPHDYRAAMEHARGALRCAQRLGTEDTACQMLTSFDRELVALERALARGLGCDRSREVDFLEVYECGALDNLRGLLESAGADVPRDALVDAILRLQPPQSGGPGEVFERILEDALDGGLYFHVQLAYALAARGCRVAVDYRRWELAGLVAFVSSTSPREAAISLLQRRGPAGVQRLPPGAPLTVRDTWIVFDPMLVRTLLQNPLTTNERPMPPGPRAFDIRTAETMVSRDGTIQRRLKRIAVRAGRLARQNLLVPTVARIVHGALRDALEPRGGEIDLVPVCERIAVEAMLVWLGWPAAEGPVQTGRDHHVPEVEIKRLLRWIYTVETAFVRVGTPEERDEENGSYLAFVEWLRHRIASSGRAPFEGFAQLFARGTRDADIDPEVTIDNIALTMVAAYQALANLLSSSLAQLLQAPEEALRARAMLSADAAEVRPILRELIRLCAPVLIVTRTARTPLLVGPARIPEDAPLRLLLGLAALGADRHDDPFSFRAARFSGTRELVGTPELDLAFGLGPHRCLGVREALLVLEEVLRQLLPHVHRMELGIPPPLPRSPIFRSLGALETLPVVVQPASNAPAAPPPRRAAPSTGTAPGSW